MMIVSVRLHRNVRQDVPADDRCLEIEDFHTILDARLENLIALRVCRRLVGHLPGLDRRHILHCFPGQVEGVDHAGRHNGAVNVAGAQPEVHRETRDDHSRDQKKSRDAGKSDQLRGRRVACHLMPAVVDRFAAGRLFCSLLTAMSLHLAHLRI